MIGKGGGSRAPWSPLGSALAAFHDRGEDVVVTVRNDFGQTEEMPASFFFRTEEAFEEWELVALRQCGPRVLDIGAGVGAHALGLVPDVHDLVRGLGLGQGAAGCVIFDELLYWNDLVGYCAH